MTDFKLIKPKIQPKIDQIINFILIFIQTYSGGNFIINIYMALTAPPKFKNFINIKSPRVIGETKGQKIN
jgi:hypothetical protein